MTLEEKYLYIEISVCAIASWAKDWSLRMKYDKSKNFTYNEGRMDRCIVASLLASYLKIIGLWNFLFSIEWCCSRYLQNHFVCMGDLILKVNVEGLNPIKVSYEFEAILTCWLGIER